MKFELTLIRNSRAKIIRNIF